ncbi:MAG: hypothetical protein E6356_01110 [Terrisporobacter othiniensis]|uniref:Uncharacterized protein n=1 Tax=Terrisporobacter hibernicus TaxID=2813371 RepID=A0AAX2ZIA5_9FIRM|nr:MULTISPECIES: hypothetical protein [Terrisporobacter]MDU4860359.1 hypothetical protein [Terrisporobacter othiniensis]MDU6993412.1 hypothetical protein [Terrisporobacter othiniensis]UEL48566.1 hypothetical protein JW646_03680 [Terrisporobacter hibernicus]SFJ36997.1 hypothetical protein SAMN02910355_2480 [Terrisporobacter glycolicus]
MIIIGEKAYLKTHDKREIQELDIDNKINKTIKAHNDEIKSTKVLRKESKTSNNDMYNNLKNKASILNRDKRHIQDKVSEIQIKQQKVENMEESLNQIKSYYLSSIRRAKQEEEKEKVKVKINKIKKEVDDLNSECITEVTELKESQDIIDAIGTALNKINDIKNKLEQYKSKLMNLECLVDKSKNELNLEEKKIETNLDENIILNPLDFISISGDLNIGIVVDIII